jgi:ABC-2 type transport system ATP-binding protein
MDLSAIDINKVEYFYRHQWTGHKIRAIHPLSVRVETGDCFGFLGNNGAGKTTTIKSILSLIHPSAGKISIFGVDSKDPKSRQSVGYVSEQPYFYDHLSVYEIVEMYAALSALTYSDRKKSVLSALSRLGISDRAKTPMRALSKGLTQRVAIAQAICHKPRLLILDEPFSGLDPIGRREIRDLFAELRDEGTTIFMSSHILSDVEALCNRASILIKGELKGVYDLNDKNQLAPKGFELTFSSDSIIDPRIIKDLAGEVVSHSNLLRLLFLNRSEAELALKKSFEHALKLEKFETTYSSLEELYIELAKKQDAAT